MNSMLKANEWKVLRAASESLTIGDIVRKTGLKYYTVSRIIRRLRQKIKIGFEPLYLKMGLLPIALITSKLQGELPPFTRATRKLRGKKGEFVLLTAVPPQKYIEDFLTLIPDRIEYIVRGFRRLFWTPNAKLTLYVKEKGCLEPKIRELSNIIREQSYTINIDSRDLDLPIEIDEIDLIPIWFKQTYAFLSLREISRLTRKYLRRVISHQLLSYHFRKHVRKLWAGNYIGIYLDVRDYPFKVLLLEGRDAPRFAKALIELPYFYRAYIEEDRALVTGQPTEAVETALKDIIKDLDVDLPFGELIMDPSLSKKVPPYIQYFKNGEWILPIEKPITTK